MRIDIYVRNSITRIENSKNVFELRERLNQLIDKIEKAMEEHIDGVVQVARAAQEGIRECSNNMESKMVFVCGQYVEKIEQMVNAYKIKERNDSIDTLMSAKVSQDIAKYLWKNGCSLREAIGCHIGISRDSFDIHMNSLLESGLAHQDIESQVEWVVLSAEGYEYMKKHYCEKEGFKIW